MTIGRTALTITLAISLAACGGSEASTTPTGGAIAGGGGGGGSSTGGCSIREQQDFARAVVDEWYLFPSLVDTSASASNFSDVQTYLDALVAPARAQSRDRGFTFATSIAEENALINSGSSAGFGIRLGYDTVNNRVFVLEAYENAPGFGAGIDRGTELLAVGTTSANLQTISSLMASGGPQAVIDALGASTAGLARVLQFRTATGVTTESSIVKADFSLDPVSDRYGTLVLNDAGKSVGYLNLRTFIVSDASDQLRDAFATFQAQGVTELIIDFRYNGGGLVDVADTLGDLLGGGQVGQIWSETVLRDSKSAENSTELFENEPNAIQPTKIAFIGRGGTASASELVINSMIPYLGNNLALIGDDTFGKPVGQFGFDLDACDLRVRAVTFQTNNADGNGEYYTGLASEVANTCRAEDDIFTQFGDPNEASIAAALDFLGGRTCTAISAAGVQQAQGAAGQTLLQPERPNAAQYEIPGLF
ncbi:MAG: S41 family peptidase [Pseudomonadota bacterium]